MSLESCGMRIFPTSLFGVYLIETDVQKDLRGSFQRLFCVNSLVDLLGARSVVQVNHSLSKSLGTVRGLHYQRAPFGEMKFVRCLRGRVWDVALDLRRGSPTFLKWFAAELSPENSRMLVIPEGCAHGFQVLDTDSELIYFHTTPYQPAYEGGVRYDDPRAAINWPLMITDVSSRDDQFSMLTESFSGIDS